MFKSTEKEVIIVESGSLWEPYPWSLHVDYEDSLTYKPAPCVHAVKIRVERKMEMKAQRRVEVEEVIYRWPFVVVAKNEGGYNSTGVCGLCIVEQIRKLQA